jgi:signal transduction histidine kinase
MGRGPWRRSRQDRILGGVAGGVAERFGVEATVVRVVFVIVTLAGGFGVIAYLAGWLLIPLEGQSDSLGSRVVRDRHGIALSLAFLPALVVMLVLGAAFHIGFLDSAAWPLFFCGVGALLVWRNCDPEERTWLRQAVEPIVHMGGHEERSRRWFVFRLVLGAVVLAAGLTLILARPATSTSRFVTPWGPVGGALLILAAVVVLFGPWWLRLVRDLVAERQARIRAEDRADMAARVHDSVLQTLAMIQRSSDQPQKVVQLARAQERELRAWLFEGDIPSAVGSDVETIAQGAQSIARDVETAHGVPVEVVTVGDCPLDDGLRALLDAAREATVNAAKWSGAPSISLFAEVEAGRVSCFVRDRGRGFDPNAVAEDRRGIAQSIHARMLRYGGAAVVRASPGTGTEVELRMPRRKSR